MRRRTLLGLAGLGAAAAVGGVGGCGHDGSVDEPLDQPVDEPETARQGVETIRYGADPSQYVELSRPSGTPRGVVVVIHGGFWKAAYDLSLGQPLAADLVDRGWAALNIEYRRVGDGGGVPATLEDVGAAIHTLVDTDLDLTSLVALGHSAGGHLAAWAGHAEDAVTHVISQAGVLDLVAADREGLGGGAVRSFLGSAPIDAAVDPLQQVPLAVPLWCVHGIDDVIVPITQSEAYVAAATAAGATAELVQVPGDHFAVIDPASQAWASTLEILDGIG